MRIIRLLLRAIVYVSILIAAACAQDKPLDKINPQPMTFSNVDFEIILGTDWRRRETQESFEWEDEKNMQEIVISVLTANELMDSGLRKTTGKRLMEIRLKSINEISDGKARMTQVETIDRDGGTELIVRGVDPANKMQIYTTVIVRPTRAVTFAYYKYQPLMTDEAFLEKSKEVRSALKVH